MKRVWDKQPPVGTPLDWTNPLTKGLKYCIHFSHGFPFDEVRGIRGVFNNNASVVPTDKGLALQCAADTTDSCYFPKDDPWITGWSEATFFALAKNRKDAADSTERLIAHIGTGDDPFSTGWIFNENTFQMVGTTSGILDDQLTDGLHPTSNAHPQNWNAIGGTWDGSTIINRVNSFEGSGTAQDGTLSVSGSANNQLYIGGVVPASGTAAWDGWVSIALIYDRSLSKAEWEALVDNPWQIFKPPPRFAFADVPDDVRHISVPKVWTKQPPSNVPLDQKHSLYKYVIGGINFADGYKLFHGPRSTSRGASIAISAGYAGQGIVPGPHGLAFDGYTDGPFSQDGLTVTNGFQLPVRDTGGGQRGITAIAVFNDGPTGGSEAPIWVPTGTFGCWLSVDVDELSINCSATPEVTTSGANMDDGAPSVVCMWYLRDGPRGIGKNGTILVDSTAASSGNNESLSLIMDTNGQGTWPANLAALYFLEGVVDNEFTRGTVKSLMDNPWQIFKPQKVFAPIPEALPDVAIVERPWG